MKLTVKTLKGEKFPIEVEATNTVAQAKSAIESTKSELPAANMKLIHSGKVLKDEETLEKYGIKDNDFLVVMVTKAKKTATKPAAAATPAPAPAAAATPATPSTSTPAAAAAASSTSESSSTAETPAANAGSSSTTATSSAPPAAPSRPATASEFPPEVIANLTALGFPETEVRHCLRAAGGNPDVAVEFLTNGIPPGIGGAIASPATPASGGGSQRPLQALRNHPQFNDLRRLVQSNPQMLQQVLTQIGQQQPELLSEINANQAAFIEMMNEPVEANAPAPSQGGSSSPGSRGPPPGMMPMADPAQVAQMMQNMDPAQMQMMANMMGLSQEQVQAVGQMIGQMPPEQLQQYMAQAMAQHGGGGGGPMGGPQVLRLTEEEMAAVNRLCDMGFDRTEAAQAYLACDKNEELAANLLLNNRGSFGFDDGLGDGGAGSGAGDSGDDMYD